MTGCEPMKSEMSVRSFDPALTVTRSGWPSKLPTKSGPGLLPDREGRGVLVVEEAVADARQQHHIVRLAVADQDVGYAVAGQVADDRGDRAGTAGFSRGPAVKVMLSPCGLVEQDRDLVGALVGDHQVGQASPLTSATVIPTGLVPAKKPCPPLIGRSELAVAQARIDEHVVAAAVGDDQVGDAVAVKVGQLDGAGGEQARERFVGPRRN